MQLRLDTSHYPHLYITNIALPSASACNAFRNFAIPAEAQQHVHSLIQAELKAIEDRQNYIRELSGTLDFETLKQTFLQDHPEFQL